MIRKGDHVGHPLLGMYESSPEAGRLHRTAPTVQPTGCELLTTSH